MLTESQLFQPDAFKSGHFNSVRLDLLVKITASVQPNGLAFLLIKVD